MKNTYSRIVVFLITCIVMPIAGTIYAQQLTIDQRVDSVLKLMTLDEKIGQLNQYSGFEEATGPVTEEADKPEQLRKGMIGSMLNVTGAVKTRQAQEMALQSRLKIPLLFGQDVIHGYRTIFPIPLAEAASWDLEAIELSARVAATEASAAGIHWTFAPMVDISRDPRWGRVMEGAGEDPYLGSLVAAARVKGFQGNGPGNTDALMACGKHFAAYGAAVGGRDYNSVDMSLQQLHNVYLKPYKAAVDAGVATMMTSFNDINGIPATAHKYILREVLRDKWNFKGFVLSDWGSVGEMINHGYSAGEADAAKAALLAGCDMDMESRCYIKNMESLVLSGAISEDVIDESVRLILRKKFEMGLFDDPFRFSNEEREKQQWDNKAHRNIARNMARKSIVLLKNDKELLPLKENVKTIAMIGPLVKAVGENNGFWSYSWPDDTVRIVTQWQGILNRAGNQAHLLYAKGCGITEPDSSGFKEAVEIAMRADVVIMSVGESANMSGEAKSRSNIQLPGVQEELIKAVYATGKPLVIIINAGRPLVFNWTADHAQAILYTWWLGTEAGNAIADVVFGDYNPSGKLPMSFPRSEGQIPVYYSYFNTGRPPKDENDLNYVSAYIDMPNSPRFPFGYGLSYTSFSISEPVLNTTRITAGEELIIKVVVSNTGNADGTETIQLYFRDKVGSLVRPLKQLAGFQQVFLPKGESRTLTFILTEKDLRFYNEHLEFVSEPGEFEVFVGNSPDNSKGKGFFLE